MRNQEAADALLARRTENSRKITAVIDTLSTRCDTYAEERLLNAVKESRNTYVASYMLALHLLRDEGKRDAAIEVMVEHTMPALYRYHGAWHEFLRYEFDEVRAATDKAQAQYAATHRTMLVVMGACRFAGSGHRLCRHPYG